MSCGRSTRSSARAEPRDQFQYASYYDASDEAGQSRLWGGIHVTPDDFTGRIIGADIGNAVYELAAKYFAGTAVP